MYRDEYEQRGFPFRDFLLKLILIIFFVFLLIWLLPKFIKPTIVEKNTNKTTTVETKGLSAQIFSNNLDKMKEAAIKYYTKDRLPKEVGQSDKMTLADMIGKKLLVPLIDKDGNPCDVEKSYVKITKLDDEYLLKVNLKTKEKKDYILVHLGCYNYCDSYVCQKEDATTVAVKGSKSTTIVYVKGKVKIPAPCKDCNVTTYIRDTKKICKYDSSSKLYYGINGYIVNKSTFLDECTPDDGVDPTPSKKICEYDAKNKTFYGITGNKVTKAKFKKQCTSPEDEPVKAKYCEYDSKTKTYYGIYGDKVTSKVYKKQCYEPEIEPENPKYCKYDSSSNKYYGIYGTVVNKATYEKECMEPEPVPETKYCEYDSKVKVYYGIYGTKVTKTTYDKQCGIPDPEPETPKYCEYDSKTKIYYGAFGKKVTKETYEKECKKPEPVPETKYCEYDSKTKTYYGISGKKVSKDTYTKECETTEKEYLYEYKKVTQSTFSAWTDWSSWAKTSCATEEVNCDDNSNSCLMKLQRFDRKEKVGTYQKAYVKSKSQLVQTGSYEQKSCSNYNYTIINNTTYVTTRTINYTTINSVTSSTRRTTGNWVYSGRGEYANPPRDTETVHYVFVGANFNYCTDTCTTLPNYYYDKYTLSGSIQKVANTVTPLGTTSTSSSSTSSNTSTSVSASCGSYVTKTIPIYSTITTYDKAYRTEPLYGTVCYKSTKTRKLLSAGSTTTKWSTYNNKTLLNSGWSYTGKKKEK